MRRVAGVRPLGNALSALSALRGGSGGNASAGEPEAALFAGIRRRLTLSYTLVLASLLVLFGVALYVGASQALFRPIDDTLASSAQSAGQNWQYQSAGQNWQYDNTTSCPPVDRRPTSLWVCTNPDGKGLNNATRIGIDILSPGTGTVIADALHNGQASDTIDVSGVGAVRRYALAVPNPSGSGYLGVIVVGSLVQGEVTALQVLLILLLILGVITLLASAFGGLFLSRRALAPARLAVARQQAFIADASHELRTPITLVRADAEVLLRGGDRLDPDDRALLQDIVTEAEHMGTLTTNLLTLARLDAGRLQVEQEVVDLREVARAVVRRVSPLAAEAGIALHTADSEETGAALVVGDRFLLEQAALILLDNAIKYNRPGGGVTVTSRPTPRQAILEVRDTGVGIAAEHLPHLTERFYRVDKARSREAGGAGLGLSIAQGIADRLGGSLSLSSDPGRGTTATLTLPLANIPAQQSAPPR